MDPRAQSRTVLTSVRKWALTLAATVGTSLPHDNQGRDMATFHEDAGQGRDVHSCGPGHLHTIVPTCPWVDADLVARHPFVGTLTVEGEADLEVRDEYREREGKPVKPQFTDFPKKAITPFGNPEEKLYVGGHLSPWINLEVEIGRAHV